MKKKVSIAGAILIFVTVMSCGSKKETAASLAQKWCDLNAKVHQAADGPAKESAKMELKKFENEMDRKYRRDDPLMIEAEKEAEKCEDASEGR